MELTYVLYVISMNLRRNVAQKYKKNMHAVILLISAPREQYGLIGAPPSECIIMYHIATW